MDRGDAEYQEREAAARQQEIQESIDWIFRYYVLDDDQEMGEIEDYENTLFWKHIMVSEGLDPNTIDGINFDRSEVEKNPRYYNPSDASRSWDRRVEINAPAGEVIIKLKIWDDIQPWGKERKEPAIEKVLTFKVSPEFLEQYKRKKEQEEAQREEDKKTAIREYSELLDLAEQHGGKPLTPDEWKSLGLYNLLVIGPRAGRQEVGELRKDGDTITSIIWEDFNRRHIVNMVNFGKPKE
jgi:hypothetical protein